VISWPSIDQAKEQTVAIPKLGVVVTSVREGRVGRPIAEWFLAQAQAHGGFEVDLIDLAEVGLPLLEEPHHPMQKRYTQDTTRAWSDRVAPIDAFVFVTPEYNGGTPPALVNALDHLYVEWNYKPAAFVSYGGVSGGTRSVQMTRQLLVMLKMAPIAESVTIPFVAKQMDGDTGAFAGGTTFEKAARTMLDELLRWTSALASLRA
jgi:NAD(P)H-dependent FMN reductase